MEIRGDLLPVSMKEVKYYFVTVTARSVVNFDVLPYEENLDNLKDMGESRHRQVFCPHTSTKKSLRTACTARRRKINQTVLTAELRTVSHRR